MELLRPMDNRGYPTEYLLARIRSRRANLVADWQGLMAAATPLEEIPSPLCRELAAGGPDEALWQGLLAENAWIYGQMERGVRVIFAPLFGYFELRTVVLSLRAVERGAVGAIGGLLEHSLLSAPFRQALLAGAPLAATVTALTRLFCGISVRFRHLAAELHSGGMAGFERELADRYLEWVSEGRLHPVIRGFFGRLVDMKNVLALHKQLRWRICSSPSFVRGGNLGEKGLRELAARGDTAGVAGLVARLARPAAADPNAASPERLLLSGLAAMLRREGREPDGIGTILDYLWRCRMEARNLGLLVHGGEFPRDILMTELVP